MALSLRFLLRNNFKLFNRNILSPLSQNVTRPLYTPSALGIDGYVDTRKSVSNQFQAVTETFRTKMTEFTNEDSKSLIFTEDLKAMLHIVENNPDDINLLIKMITKYYTQNNELRFGNYVFGPVAMRTFYYLDVPDVALELFKDNKLNGFFDQLTSYQVLLSLLFKHEKYAEMRAVYDIIKSKASASVVHPHNSILLLMAGCYKENSEESVDYAMNVWSDLIRRGFDPSRKTVCLLSYLALKRGRPDFALEFLSNFAQYRHIDVRCTRLAILTSVKKFQDIYMFLGRMLQSDRYISGTTKPITFFKDVIEDLEKALKENGPGNEELERLLSEMRNRDLIQDVTLEESLLSPIEKRVHLENPNEPSRNMNKRFTQDASQARFSMRR